MGITNQQKLKGVTAYDWNEQAVESLKKFWGDGYSASMIGRELGISRNAVIGKVHRMKLPARLTTRHLPNRPGTGRPRKKKAWKGNLNLPKFRSDRKLVALADLKEPTTELSVGILELSNKTCRWPLGDPKDTQMLYCGQNPTENSVYCEYHFERSRREMRPSSEVKKPMWRKW